MLEVKDWKLAGLSRADKFSVWLRGGGLRGGGLRGSEKRVHNPLAQARQYLLKILDLLQRDPALIHPPVTVTRVSCVCRSATQRC